MVNIVKGIPDNRADLGDKPFVCGVNWFPYIREATVEALVVRYCAGQGLPVFFGNFDLARPDLGGDDLGSWYASVEEDVVYSYDDSSGLQLPGNYGQIYRFDPRRTPVETEKYVLYVRPVGDVRSITLEFVLPKTTVTLAYNELVPGNPINIGSIAPLHTSSWVFIAQSTTRLLTDEHSLFAIAEKARRYLNFE